MRNETAVPLTINAAFASASAPRWRRTDEFEAQVFKMSTVVAGLMIPGVSDAAAGETLERRAKVVGLK